jgi:hypothetical protein
MHIALLYPSKAGPQAVAPPQPQTITLEPLGYVQKADGRVEAIISLGERVQVVHEGEIVEDKFRVAKISSSNVELVESLAPAAQVRLTAEVGQGVAQDAAGKAGQTNSLPFPELASNTGPARQLDAAPAARPPKPSDRQELGYVERADGGVEAIVADGEHVRLSPETKSFASSFHVPPPSPANLEVENALPSAINPPGSVVHEYPPTQANSFAQEAGGTPLVASGAETSAMAEAQGVPRKKGQSESEPLGIIQPEPLADYSGSRFEPWDVAPVPQVGTAGADPSPATAGSGQARVGGAAPSLFSDGRGTQSGVNTLGYVEKAGGEKEAIVEVLGQVYLVHEGELFAEQYRALQVTPSSVKIVEESTKGSSVPAGIRRDSKAVAPPIATLRGLPVSTGSSGADLPAEVRKAEELAAGERSPASAHIWEPKARAPSDIKPEAPSGR